MLLDGQSSPMLLVISQLAQEGNPPQLSWIIPNGLDFGLALYRGCHEPVAKLQIVLTCQSMFPSKHIRALKEPQTISIY